MTLLGDCGTDGGGGREHGASAPMQSARPVGGSGQCVIYVIPVVLLLLLLHISAYIHHNAYDNDQQDGQDDVPDQYGDAEFF